MSTSDQPLFGGVLDTNTAPTPLRPDHPQQGRSMQCPYCTGQGLKVMPEGSVPNAHLCKPCDGYGVVSVVLGQDGRVNFKSKPPGT